MRHFKIYLTANISHKKMPSYEEHVQFVHSKSYSVWYIIIANNEG